MKECYKNYYGEWETTEVKIDPRFPSIIIYLGENILLNDIKCFLKKVQDFYDFEDFEHILRSDGGISIKTTGNITDYDLIKVIFFKVYDKNEERWEIINGEWAQV